MVVVHNVHNVPAEQFLHGRIKTVHLFCPPITHYAVRVIVIDAYRRTKIEGVVVTAASYSVASTYAAETERQHPRGTVIVVDVLMCHTFPTAVGVTIATLSGIVTPLIVIPRATGVTAPPVGIDTFAWTVTLY